jgi:hypothetical protein
MKLNLRCLNITNSFLFFIHATFVVIYVNYRNDRLNISYDPIRSLNYPLVMLPFVARKYYLEKKKTEQ